MHFISLKMSFGFSDLVIPNDDNDTNDNYDYDYAQFLADPIYDWLNFPEEILQVCNDVEEKDNKEEKTKNQKLLQLFNNHNHIIIKQADTKKSIIVVALIGKKIKIIKVLPL